MPNPIIQKGIMTDRFFITVNPAWAMNRKSLSWRC